MEIQIIILILSLVLSALFSGIETAVISITNFRTRFLVKEKRSGSQYLLKLKENQGRFLITILIGNNIVNITAASIATFLMTERFGSYGVGIAAGIMTFLILFFGEITPKLFAITHAERIALLFSRFILLLQKILFPIILIFELVSNRVVKSLGIPKKRPYITEDELKYLFKIGVEEGEFEKKESELLENVLKFNDITAKEVMTPRLRIFSLDSNKKLKDVIDQILDSMFSRIPIYEKTRDNIIGIVFVKDLLRMINDGKRDTSLKKISKKPYFVPENKVINQLFKEFQDTRTHMAFVVDEFGALSGLITLEDLLEEIVGEIIDESDVSENLIKRISKNEILVNPDTEIKDVNRFFNVELPGKENQTVSSLVLKKIKRIPKEKEVVQIGNVDFLILEADSRKIKKIQLIKKE